jgi:hypothetical protein
MSRLASSALDAQSDMAGLFTFGCSMNTLKEKLDTVERNKLRKLEVVVAEGITSFLAVGEALKEIRDLKLYRESHKTFEKYVDQKWGMQKSQAYRLIDASVVSQNLSPMGDKNERVAEITTERQLRELKDVPVESIEAVVNKAADIAGEKTITASDIKQAREEVLSEPEPSFEVPGHNSDQWQDVDDTPEPEPAKPDTPQSDDPKALQAPIQAVATQLNGMLKELKRLSDHTGGEWLDISDLETQIEALKYSIRQSIYWMDCMDCGGKGCKTCRQIGWLSLDRKKHLTQAQKDLVGA